MLDLMSFERQSYRHCWLLLKGFLFSLLANAQQSPDSSVRQLSANLHQSPASLPESYVRTRIDPDSRLFNGREYIRNGIYAKGFPFFEWDSLQTGSLTYDGILYPEMAMEYNLVSDEVIIHNFAGDALISLVPEKITSFSIGGYHFRYVATAGIPPAPLAKAASIPAPLATARANPNLPATAAIARATPNLPEAGFYEELYATPRFALLARRKKMLIFPSTQEEQPKYVRIDRYFLLIDDNAYSIHNENELMAVLKDKKDPLKKFIRKNKLSFKQQHFENSLIQTTIYYHEIKQ
jgi:hypothetical protein